MASKSLFGVLVLVVLHSIQAEGNNNFNLAVASKALSDKGYHAMFMIFDVFFKTHDVSQWLTGNSTLTVFSPPDHAFSSSKYPQPLTLLHYHVVYLKLNIEALASIPYGPKIDTLLLGHPLTLIYPWLDVKNQVHAEVSSGFSWVIKELTENQFLPLLAMVQQEEEEIKEVVDHVLNVKAVCV
ncbi:hypothetical protein FEM48_Zijuj01G0246600 [Ziziphus jujuba var. spinosa]|uniref:FAS1 domain-containing protein n=1 Tax=Ziziphus jujuba var. spinosa TaxID=714518 RepID=A0A978W4I4_ZIZJJ|nr:hypothetical protein FEM48_Zijuj01G0246600 [Ziziphus jujuba var. spinosa]